MKKILSALLALIMMLSVLAIPVAAEQVEVILFNDLNAAAFANDKNAHTFKLDDGYDSFLPGETYTFRIKGTTGDGKFRFWIGHYNSGVDTPAKLTIEPGVFDVTVTVTTKASLKETAGELRNITFKSHSSSTSLNDLRVTYVGLITDTEKGGPQPLPGQIVPDDNTGLPGTTPSVPDTPDTPAAPAVDVTIGGYTYKETEIYSIPDYTFWDSETSTNTLETITYPWSPVDHYWRNIADGSKTTVKAWEILKNAGDIGYIKVVTSAGDVDLVKLQGQNASGSEVVATLDAPTYTAVDGANTVSYYSVKALKDAYVAAGGDTENLWNFVLNGTTDNDPVVIEAIKVVTLVNPSAIILGGVEYVAQTEWQIVDYTAWDNTEKKNILTAITYPLDPSNGYYMNIADGSKTTVKLYDIIGRCNNDYGYLEVTTTGGPVAEVKLQGQNSNGNEVNSAAIPAAITLSDGETTTYYYSIKSLVESYENNNGVLDSTWNLVLRGNTNNDPIVFQNIEVVTLKAVNGEGGGNEGGNEGGGGSTPPEQPDTGSFTAPDGEKIVYTRELNKDVAKDAWGVWWFANDAELWEAISVDGAKLYVDVDTSWAGVGYYMPITIKAGSDGSYETTLKPESNNSTDNYTVIAYDADKLYTDFTAAGGIGTDYALQTSRGNHETAVAFKVLNVYVTNPEKEEPKPEVVETVIYTLTTNFSDNDEYNGKPLEECVFTGDAGTDKIATNWKDSAEWSKLVNALKNRGAILKIYVEGNISKVGFQAQAGNSAMEVTPVDGVITVSTDDFMAACNGSFAEDGWMNMIVHAEAGAKITKIQVVRTTVVTPPVQPTDKDGRRIGWFVTSENTHAFIIGRAIITMEHTFNDEGVCTLCRYEKTIEE